MTHRQLTWLGAVSVLATALVLFAGLRPPGLSAAAKAAIGRSTPSTGQPVVATAGASNQAQTSSDSDDDADSAEDAADAGHASTNPSDDLGTATVADDPSDAAGSASDDSTADSESADTSTDGAAADGPKATNIKHVFVITLDGKGFDAAFGSGSSAPYLAGELRAQGTLLTNFSSLGRAGLPDRLAFAGGQPPNASTNGECTVYKEIGALVSPSKSGEITDDGCVYPNTIISLGDQLTANRLTWQAYAEDHEKGPGGPATLCRRPVSNETDETQTPRAGDAYAARNNPFIYFHSLLDLSGCDADVGPLSTLDGDLADVKKTPSLAYIAPNLCHDGSTQTACGEGAPTGLAAADGFLQTVVPKILSSTAYKDNGLLVITFAGGPSDGPNRNGTLLLSRFAEAGGTDDTALDPYALLRSTEDLLGLKPLAKAATAKSFADTVLASARVTVAGDD
ncbi:MAG: phosphoesterase [Solirubrobacteraceae bacterium]|nr:phosphoesterase [Solirubrobacteraceae bacterium]